MKNIENYKKSVLNAPINAQEKLDDESENVKVGLFFRLLLGAIVGFVSGLFGGGGGMIAVPVLTDIFKKQQKIAHATALLVILPVTIISSVLYSVYNYFDTKIVILTSMGVVLGGVLGAIFLKRFSNGAIRIIFSLVMLVFGLKLLFF